MIDDAVLVTDELVTNSLHHGQTPRICRLTLLHHHQLLRIEVDDASTREPRIRASDHTDGRGLILVDRLSSRWGTEHHNDHKTVGLNSTWKPGAAAVTHRTWQEPGPGPATGRTTRQPGSFQRHE